MKIMVFTTLINMFVFPVFAHELLAGITISHTLTENTFPKIWPTPKFETLFSQCTPFRGRTVIFLLCNTLHYGFF
jgi:hypothetical protein